MVDYNPPGFEDVPLDDDEAFSLGGNKHRGFFSKKAAAYDTDAAAAQEKADANTSNDERQEDDFMVKAPPPGLEEVPLSDAKKKRQMSNFDNSKCFVGPPPEGMVAVDLSRDDAEVIDLVSRMAEKKKRVPHSDASWQEGLRRNKEGSPLSNLRNAVHILENDAAWSSKLAYNEMACRVEVNGENVDDGAVQEIRRWLQDIALSHVSTGDVHSAVDIVARKNAYHPVRRYLRHIKWDGVERLGGWLSQYLGAEDDEYTRAVGRMVLISAVARVMKPGCKVDTMMVLEGKQGAMKSTACRVLAGDEYFSDSLPNDLSNKDASSHIAGKWLVEMAELGSLSKTETVHFKAFLTRQEEKYRPSYGRHEIVQPRQCIFIGTTNQEAYLKDETGGRRFWPVKCGKIMIDELKGDRDQLWAEAVAAFDAKEQWWVDRKTEKDLFAPQQEMRFTKDEWEDPVRDFVEGALLVNPKRAFTTREIFTDVLGFDAMGKVGRADSNRLISVLLRVGLKKRISAGKDVWRAV